MSSLSQQLKAIGKGNQSVALDRKQRSKLHSRSLLFDQKTAASQDYDLIYLISSEGYEELCDIDSRFLKFRSTLFSETSVSMDRNVQEKDVVEMLDKNVNAFLSLAAPYYQILPTVKAVEWLVRRFYANIHNAEMMLLSALPHYGTPVFVKILNVVPQASFPKIFEWVMGYKTLLKSPTSASLVKAFSDPLFFQFYSMYLIELSQNGSIYKEQIVLYLANLVQVLGLLSRQPERLTEHFLPRILESVGQLLSQGGNDAILSAFSIISVLGSVLPLSSNTIDSIIALIIESDIETLQKQALITIGLLYHGKPQSEIELSKAISTVPVNYILKYGSEILQEGVKLQDFLVAFFLATENLEVFPLLDLSKSRNFEAISLVILENAGQDPKIPSICDKLLSHNKDQFLAALNKFKDGFKLSDLEMILMTTLDNLDEFISSETVEIEEEDAIEDAPVEILLPKSDEDSFLVERSTGSFQSLVESLIKSIRSKQASVAQFSKAVFKNPEVSISFYLRVSLTPLVPLAVRLSSLKFIKRRLKELKEQIYLLTPILLLGLYDSIQSIRSGFTELLQVIRTSTSNLKDLFMEEAIYASMESSKRSLISPSDSKLLLSLLEDLQNVVLDREQASVLLNDIFTKQKKRLGQLFKTFIYTQWSLPFAIVFKYPAWALADEGKFFIKDIDAFLGLPNKRALVESSKIPFRSVEHALFGIVDDADKLLNSLKITDIDQDIVISRIRTLFPHWKLDCRLKVMTSFIELLSSEGDVQGSMDPLEILQSLPLDSELAISLLKVAQISLTVPEQSIPKRRRRSSLSTRSAMARNDINNIASTLMKKLTIILDVLETALRKKTQDTDLHKPELLQSLFRSLTDLEYLGNDGNLPVLYAQETLATCMQLIILQLGDAKLDSNSVRADLIVNTIRNSQSPQVQNRFLLVIAALADIAPEIILHSVMPIFTFMGAHTIRQDDEFSNLVIQETIAKVVPALATDSNEVEFLLASFCTAIPHVPLHRRVNLFVSLMRTLKPENSLHILLFLLAQDFSASVSKGKNHESRSTVDFVASVLVQFSALDQLNAIAKFYQFWSEISESNDDEAPVRPLFTNVSPSMKPGMIQFVDAILRHEENTSEDSLKMKITLRLFGSNEEVLVPFREIVSFILSELEVHPEGSDILTELFKLLNQILDLLPLQYFIKAIFDSINNLKNGNPLHIGIARNIAILAGHKIETELNLNNITEDIESIVLEEFVPMLLSNIEININSALQQSLLDAYASTINKFASSLGERAKAITSSLSIITSECGLRSENLEVIVASINASTSIVNALGVKIIGFFPKIVPRCIEIWTNSKENEDFEEDELQILQTSILILFSCLVKKMPAFLVSCLDKLLVMTVSSEFVDSAIRSNLLNVIIEHMDSNALIKSLCNIWKEVSTFNDAEIIGLYLNCVQLTVEKIDKKTAVKQATLFMKWLITSFEFSSKNELKAETERFDINTVRRLEGSFHACGIQYSMKLNDRTFRPLFASLVRWAVSGEGSRVECKKTERLAAFFKFFNKLQEQLKSIITLYYSYVVDPVSGLLTQFAKNDLQDVNLRRILLNSLTSSFKYDQDDFWSQQLRFDTIEGPLLEQLSNIEDSIGKYVVKSITAFAVNVASDEHNEKLVHGLIKYISNNEENVVSSKTKLWTVKVLRQVFQKMGEQWLPFLPTLIPYIAELLEDDDEAVESEVRRGLVKVIEKVLGEPLDRYLD